MSGWRGIENLAQNRVALRRGHRFVPSAVIGVEAPQRRPHVFLAEPLGIGHQSMLADQLDEVFSVGEESLPISHAAACMDRVYAESLPQQAADERQSSGTLAPVNTAAGTGMLPGLPP